MSKSLVRESLEILGFENNLKQDKKKRRKNKSRGSKITVPFAKKLLESKLDATDENTRRLLLLSCNRSDRETADKLFMRATTKSCIPKEEKSTEPESTVFTEEDFKKFEEEYHEL